jgi:hypothetical protein
MGFCRGADFFGGQRGTHANTIYRFWTAVTAAGGGKETGGVILVWVTMETCGERSRR